MTNNQLESTHRVQTSIKECVLVHNVKSVRNEIRLIVKIIGIIVLTPESGP